MKFIVLSLILLLSYSSFASTSNPRETFRTYLKAMVKIKQNKGSKSSNYQTAISTLDLSSVDKSLRDEVGEKRVQQLINTLDKIKKVQYDLIPENPTTPIWYFDKRMYQDKFLEISVLRKDGQWLFSLNTLNSLDMYEEALKQKGLAKGVIRLNRISDKIRKSLPTFFNETYLLFENWQWFGLIFILIFSFFIEKISKVIITYIINHTSKLVLLSSPEKLSTTIDPLAKIIFVFVSMKLIIFLDFGVKSMSVIQRILYIAMSIMAVWLAHKIIEYISYNFAKKAQRTSTKFDDILIPLLTKTAFIITYILGALLVANSLTIDVTGVIAGLGIGGLAFAFAAKDTLANFFGSIMLVLDRPFDIGDIITAGDVEGVVSEVGFRSTRIRTFNDSLITIANGELMNRPIDNKGKRRFRRLVTTLGLEYDTPPEKIEAFCEGIRQLIVSYRWTRKDNFHVYFTNFGDFSLDIKLIVYWKTGDFSRELSEKHRLMIDILRLADELEVAFAFPTQTLHMFSETRSEKEIIDTEYLKQGIQKAKSVIERPLSLKNPRSNSEDKDQFGDNDVGL